MKTYVNIDGIECVTWTNEQGTHSMTKAHYEAQLKLVAEIVLPDANKL